VVHCCYCTLHSTLHSPLQYHILLEVGLQSGPLLLLHTPQYTTLPSTVPYPIGSGTAHFQLVSLGKLHSQTHTIKRTLVFVWQYGCNLRLLFNLGTKIAYTYTTLPSTVLHFNTVLLDRSFISTWNIWIMSMWQWNVTAICDSVCFIYSQDMQDLDRKIAFLQKRVDEANQIKWQGTLKKNPLWWFIVTSVLSILPSFHPLLPHPPLSLSLFYIITMLRPSFLHCLIHLSLSHTVLYLNHAPSFLTFFIVSIHHSLTLFYILTMLRLSFLHFLIHHSLSHCSIS